RRVSESRGRAWAARYCESRIATRSPLDARRTARSCGCLAKSSWNFCRRSRVSATGGSGGWLRLSPIDSNRRAIFWLGPPPRAGCRRRLMKSTIELIRESPFFETLAPEDIDALAAHARMRSVAAGEVILRENDPAEALYMIVAGEGGLVLVRAPRRTPTLPTADAHS